MGESRYDPEVDAAYVTVGPPIADGGVARTVPVDLPDDISGELFLDFDRDGRLLGIEVLGASRLLRPEGPGA
ncbi:DUF2283 domain-containing protein [Microbacterium sp. NPDC089320]|uniref:DUF2283 domain-containing protein n=1 Tax=Microbacterium sp. NPDC089320 TaxID=3155182 RepID=UPI00143BF4FB